MPPSGWHAINRAPCGGSSASWLWRSPSDTSMGCSSRPRSNRSPVSAARALPIARGRGVAERTERLRLVSLQRSEPPAVKEVPDHGIVPAQPGQVTQGVLDHVVDLDRRGRVEGGPSGELAAPHLGSLKPQGGGIGVL